MTDMVIEYKSSQKTIHNNTHELDYSVKDGVVCTWSGNIEYDYFSGGRLSDLSWNFDWTKLKNEGVDSLTGFIKVMPTPGFDHFEEQKINFVLKEATRIVRTIISSTPKKMYARFEYSLTPHYANNQKISYDEMFAASDKTDAILVVEEKKIHVNKAFLSFHSDFFTALFFSSFKEGQMAEIPIKDVSYEDFGLLMSAIYPKQVFPNDETAAKLLELADRFLIPSVPHIVEHRLLEHSELENRKLMWMADAYGMPTLLGKCIRAVNTKEKAKIMQISEEYKKLSFETKEKLFERILQID